jgi:putative flippase GtrA
MISKVKKAYYNKEFLKFVFVGIINTVNHNIIYLISLSFFSYLVSNIIAFFISMIISFFLNCRFTFNIKPTLKKLMIFPLSNIPNFFFQTIGIYVIVTIIGIPKEYGALIATVLALPLTFIMMRFLLLFKKK